MANSLALYVFVIGVVAVGSLVAIYCVAVAAAMLPGAFDRLRLRRRIRRIRTSRAG